MSLAELPGPHSDAPRTPLQSAFRLRLALVLTLAVIAPANAWLRAQSGATRAGLQIVVIEGEDAVNVVQQKTAVAPVVEVRDRNNQPVAGAVVRFSIRNGRATFNGARTVSVTTNAAGRAVATGFTPTSSGLVQIGAAASFQGQTAVATIVQTNVMTIAQAAAVGTAGAGASGAAATAGGAAGGAGGGLSATTIAIVGGAVAGGAVLTQQLVFDDGFPGLFVTNFRGATPLAILSTNANGMPTNCIRQLDVTGTLTIENNHVNIDWTETPTSSTCFVLGTPRSQTGVNNDLTGPPDKLHWDRWVSGTAFLGDRVQFDGALNAAGDSISGALTIFHSFAASLPPPQTFSESYTVQIPVTLLKQ